MRDPLSRQRDPEDYPSCVVCFKPLGDDQHELEDGCLAHAGCVTYAVKANHSLAAVAEGRWDPT